LKKNYYVVKAGRKPGIYMTWNDCKAQVEGFAGAKYKGFATREEAVAWQGGAEAKKLQVERAAILGEPDPLFPEPSSLSPESGPLFPEPASLSSEPASLFSEPVPAEVDYIIYTDGSCLRNPAGPGGYAVILLDAAGNLLRELSGGEPSTTNNRMELMAGITALEAVEPGSRVALYTDSQYMQNGFVKYWLRNWKRNGWKTATGNPVSNQDLWQRLDALVLSHKVKFHWVKGHANQKYNERCDELAKAAAGRQKK
jgi:ribonuclease HI